MCSAPHISWAVTVETVNSFYYSQDFNVFVHTFMTFADPFTRSSVSVHAVCDHRDRNTSNKEIMWHTHGLGSLPVCISGRTHPAPSRTPHSLQTAAPRRTWPPETQNTRASSEHAHVWLTCVLRDAHCVTYVTGGWTMIKGFLVSEIRGQIDFIGVSHVK